MFWFLSNFMASKLIHNKAMPPIWSDAQVSHEGQKLYLLNLWDSMTREEKNGRWKNWTENTSAEVFLPELYITKLSNVPCYFFGIRLSCQCDNLKVRLFEVYLHDRGPQCYTKTNESGEKYFLGSIFRKIILNFSCNQIENLSRTQGCFKALYGRVALFLYMSRP